jgi:NadR type nicotinamide-nucleotide adenylyltransferase
VAPSESNEHSVVSVVVTGSECTGKTTLATALAREYGVECVPEYVRQFIATMGGRPQYSDHGPIARGQKALEDEYRARARKLLIHDTDLISTVTYCRHYFGRCPEWIEADASVRRAGLYLLCEIDVPWQDDGLRDRGERRKEMHEIFRSVLDDLGATYVVVSGSPEKRIAAARVKIDSLVS